MLISFVLVAIAGILEGAWRINLLGREEIHALLYLREGLPILCGYKRLEEHELLSNGRENE